MEPNNKEEPWIWNERVYGDEQEIEEPEELPNYHFGFDIIAFIFLATIAFVIMRLL